MGVYDYHHDSGRSDCPEVRSDAPLSEHAQETLKFIYDGQKCGIRKNVTWSVDEQRDAGSNVNGQKCGFRIFVSLLDGNDENGNS